jgi:hypothetical protein
MLQTFLVSQNDIPSFTNEHIREGTAEVFVFDKVVNESSNQSSIYTKLIREDVHLIAKEDTQIKSFCFLLFGPTDSSEK